MKIKQIKQVGNNSFYKDLKLAVDLNMDFNEEVEQVVFSVIQNIRKDGDKALLNYTAKFDNNNSNLDELKITKEALKKAWENITKEQQQALEVAKIRITKYAQKQKLEGFEIIEQDSNGSGKSTLGQKITAMDSVGLYVPGGTAAYPSSVLMNAIPAKVAGVKRLVMVSPAMNGKLNKQVLAAAYLCDIDEFYAIGGAQAIATLAYGTQTIKSVNKIVGPGNIYVATAKKQVFGKVAIDMIAGPSEIAIISDGNCNPKWVAADMFSQAEHDENAQSILITNCETHAKKVIKNMAEILKTMPRKEIIEKSIETRGVVVVVETINDAVSVANFIAPEHLEILTKNATEVSQQINHAGAIFIGNYSCEAFGDYLAGPNHVLPTSGSAKFSSPLGVYDFQKRTSIINLSEDKASELAKYATISANSEGLFAHELSAELRKKQPI